MSGTSFAAGFLGAFLGSRGMVRRLFKLGWYGLLLAIAAVMLLVTWWRSLSLGWQALIIVGLLALVTWRLLRMSERTPAVVEHTPYELHYLYRWWAPDGTLLYVGLTNDFERRSGEHAKSKPWMVPGVQATVQTFPSRAELVAAERHAIRTEQPVYNKVRYT